MKIILFTFFTLTLSSCSMFSSNDSGAYIKSKVSYQSITKNLDKNWENLKAEGSDLALKNKKSGSTFLINSACRKNDNSNLNSLASSILSGIEDLNVISKSTKAFQEREAQEIRFSGKVDGVITFANILTLQKNFCIFDFVLISKNLKNLNDDYKSFNEFINKVTIE